MSAISLGHSSLPLLLARGSRAPRLLLGDRLKSPPEQRVGDEGHKHNGQVSVDRDEGELEGVEGVQVSLGHQLLCVGFKSPFKILFRKVLGRF